jgi:hypothetical protein
MMARMPNALVLVLAIVLSSATATASPWRVDPGPALLSGGRWQKIATLDDGRVILDTGYLPQLLDVVGWRFLGDRVVAGTGPSLRIPGGVLVARGAFLHRPGRGGLVWDAKTDRWRDTGGITRLFEPDDLAATLADGSALVLGGIFDGDPKLVSVERWTAKADGFAPAGSPRTAHRDGTLTALPDGRALLAGGADEPSRGHWTAQCDVYDPVTNAWTATGDLHIARRGHTTTLLPDGRVLVAGGQGKGERPIAELEVWDPKTGAWTIAGRLREPRSYHAAVLLPGSRVMFVGGTRGDDVYVTFENGTAALTAETWNATTNTWEAVFYPPRAYERPMIATLQDGRLVVAGGLDFTTALTSVELWSPVAGRDAPWELASPPLTPALALPSDMANGSTLTPLADGTALAVGGNAWQQLAARRWDPKTSAWLGVAIHTLRIRHVAAPLLDGRVLVAGGVGLIPKTGRMTMAVPRPPSIVTAEVFDPATGTFTPTGVPTRARDGAAAATLADGRVLITGGGSATAEVWMPGSGRFTAVPDMAVARTRHTATRLRDGRVVVIGGDEKGTYEVYDPAKDRWTPPRPLPERWNYHSAVLAGDGRILVTAGDRTVALRID